MLATAMYVLDNTDFLPEPGWQMGYDNWAASANLSLQSGAHASLIVACVQFRSGNRGGERIHVTGIKRARLFALIA